MELITNQEQLKNLVRYCKEEKKKICRIAILSTIHDGHLLVLRKIKENCDILIADIVEYMYNPWNSLLGKNIVLSTEKDHDQISKVLNESGIIDFVIFNNSTPKYQKGSLEFVMKYKDKFFNFCKDLGLSKDVAISGLVCGILSPIDEVTTSYVGPKNILQTKIAEKVFGQESRWSCEHVWNFYRNQDGGTLSRTRGSITLSHTVLSIVKELKRGITDFETLNRLMYNYYMQDPHFTIIDLDTIEKMDHITDNCSLVFMDGDKSDFVHIKNGELIY